MMHREYIEKNDDEKKNRIENREMMGSGGSHRRPLTSPTIRTMDRVDGPRNFQGARDGRPLFIVFYRTRTTMTSDRTRTSNSAFPSRISQRACLMMR
jgi:hypothetical protein